MIDYKKSDDPKIRGMYHSGYESGQRDAGSEISYFKMRSYSTRLPAMLDRYYEAILRARTDEQKALACGEYDGFNDHIPKEYRCPRDIKEREKGYTSKTVDIDQFASTYMPIFKEVYERGDRINLSGELQGVIVSKDSDVEIEKNWCEIHYSTDGSDYELAMREDVRKDTREDYYKHVKKRYDDLRAVLGNNRRHGLIASYGIMLVDYKHLGKIVKSEMGTLDIIWNGDPSREILEQGDE